MIKKILKFTLIMATIGLASFLLAFQESEKNLEELEAAKKTFINETESNKKMFLKKMEEQIKNIAKTGNLDAVQKLIAEKKDFETNEKNLPTSKDFKSLVNEFQKQNKKGKEVLLNLYDRKIKELTKNLDLETAIFIKKEFDQFQKTGSFIQNNSETKNVDTEHPKNTEGKSVKNSAFNFDGVWHVSLLDSNLGSIRTVNGDKMQDKLNGEYLSWKKEGNEITVTFKKLWDKLHITNNNKLTGRTSTGKGVIYERILDFDKSENLRSEASNSSPKFNFTGIWMVEHPKNNWKANRGVVGNNVYDFNNVKCTWKLIDNQITVSWPNGGWEKLYVNFNDPSNLKGKHSRGFDIYWHRITDQELKTISSKEK